MWETFVPQVGAGALYKFEVASEEPLVLLRLPADHWHSRHETEEEVALDASDATAIPLSPVAARGAKAK